MQFLVSSSDQDGSVSQADSGIMVNSHHDDSVSSEHTPTGSTHHNSSSNSSIVFNAKSSVGMTIKVESKPVNGHVPQLTHVKNNGTKRNLQQMEDTDGSALASAVADLSQQHSDDAIMLTDSFINPSTANILSLVNGSRNYSAICWLLYCNSFYSQCL